jgi:hypothetical protein
MNKLCRTKFREVKFQEKLVEVRKRSQTFGKLDPEKTVWILNTGIPVLKALGN